MPNALDPNHMTASEWLREVGEILAVGMIRLRMRQQEAAQRHSEVSSVDFSGNQSVHGGTAGQGRKSHD